MEWIFITGFVLVVLICIGAIAEHFNDVHHERTSRTIGEITDGAVAKRRAIANRYIRSLDT